MGSTVILLFSKDSIQWEEHLKCGTKIQFGEKIGQIN